MMAPQMGGGYICDEYARNDERIRVFHKENGGVSSARNLGLKNAKGEWITFVDADDFISNTFIEHLIAPIMMDSSVQFAYCSGTYFKNGKAAGIMREYQDCVSSDNTSLFDMFNGYVWGKVFKREIIESVAGNSPIRFDETVRLAEDWLFTVEYILRINKYALSSEVGYNYNKDNETSATNANRLSYEERLYIFKKQYMYEMKYVELNHIQETDISKRLHFSAISLYGILEMINQMNIPIREKVNKVRNELGLGPLHILSFRGGSVVSRYIDRLFVNGSCHTAFMLMPVVRGANKILGLLRLS